MKVGLHFGALAAPLHKQLAGQGLKFRSAADRKLYQNDADSITFLSVRGIIAQSEARKARKRLLKRILSELVETKPGRAS